MALTLMVVEVGILDREAKLIKGGHSCFVSHGETYLLKEALNCEMSDMEKSRVAHKSN